PGLDELCLEDGRVDPRDHLAFRHDRVEVDEELLDLARHLTAHLDGDDRVEVAAGRDGGGEWTELSAGGPILRRAAADLVEFARFAPPWGARYCTINFYPLRSSPWPRRPSSPRTRACPSSSSTSGWR